MNFNVHQLHAMLSAGARAMQSESNEQENVGFSYFEQAELKELKIDHFRCHPASKNCTESAMANWYGGAGCIKHVNATGW
jgi:hypothetical protein